ncbi:hypothetical protein [Haloarcula sp. 1CSR25-25]|uniref:hypothetical protein n=1 Tax=Haloarcula sp. 1CSR25-25 TaxID=2862545 RepID=UPI002895C0D3|nr:hypothetical protein [Haloarcula sp. 1CSR25-25]MDT3434742.1 hypothetical protein [Haloarcula sp. 1CSR25-25]
MSFLPEESMVPGKANAEADESGVPRWREQLLSEPNATVFLALFALVTLAVVAYNAVTILQYRGVITAATDI